MTETKEKQSKSVGVTQLSSERLVVLKKTRDRFLLKHFNVVLYPSQRKVSDRLLEAVFSFEGTEIPAEFSRQAGKTTAIVYTVAFIIYLFKQVIGRGIRIGIFAPQKEQAKTDFDRLKVAFNQLNKNGIDMGFREYNATTLRPETPDYVYDTENGKIVETPPATLELDFGNEVFIFPISKTSNPESKTLDLIIIEEAQSVDDFKMKNAVFPMGASTNASRIFIGTAGYHICYFYRKLQQSQDYVFDYKKVIQERREAYDLTKRKYHLNYEKYVLKERNEQGEDSDEFKTQYGLEWVLGAGQFITMDEFNSLIGDFGRSHHNIQDPHFAGIDTAKSPDSTVVTILRGMGENKRRLVNWMELKGDNYQDQFDIIWEFLKRYDIKALAIDSTGQGDFMPDMFQAHTRWQDENSGLYRVKFNLSSKDVLYKNLMVVCREFLTSIPKIDTKEAEKFKQQMLDLQKEYKGDTYLSCHHPDEPYAHDDYCDSWALSEYAFAQYNKINQIGVRVISPQDDKRIKDFIEEWDDENFS